MLTDLSRCSAERRLSQISADRCRSLKFCSYPCDSLFDHKLARLLPGFKPGLAIAGNCRVDHHSTLEASPQFGVWGAVPFWEIVVRRSTGFEKPSRARSGPTSRWLSGVRMWVLIAVGVVAVAGGAWTLWPSNTAKAPAPQARQYSNFSACLLTDDVGVGSRQARPVWAGMQQASAQTSARVSFLEAVGPTDADNISSYLNTLLQRRCNVVLAAGAPQVAAVVAAASSAPGTHFIVVGAPSAGPNVASLAAGGDDAVAGAVARLIDDAVGGRFKGWASGAS